MRVRSACGMAALAAHLALAPALVVFPEGSVSFGGGRLSLRAPDGGTPPALAAPREGRNLWTSRDPGRDRPCAAAAGPRPLSGKGRPGASPAATPDAAGPGAFSHPPFWPQPPPSAA